MPIAEDRFFFNQGIFSDESIREYLAEAEEQIAGMEEQLLVLEEGRSDGAAIRELFRHLHGLKGNTGLLLSEAQTPIPEAHPLQYLQKTSHAVESVVDGFRSAAPFTISDEEMEFLFQALGLLQRQIKAFRQDRIAAAEDAILLGKLGLSDLVAGTAPRDLEEREHVFKNAGLQNVAAGRMFLDQLPEGGGPALKNLLRAIETLVKAAHYGGNQAIVDLGKAQIGIIEVALASSNPLEIPRLGELRDLHGQIEALFLQAAEDTPEFAGEPEEPAPDRAVDDRYGVIRVDQRKIDELMRIAGQMVVFRNQLSSFADRVDRADVRGDWKAELRNLNDDFSRSADQLQHGVISLRLLPLGSLFQRLQRLVRDLSVALGKEIRLVTQGEEIQIDKALLDRLGEPLVHLLRNAADHGIESSESRARNGKSPIGTISVRAFRDASAVVFSVSDDGSGIDTQTVRAHAIEVGLVSSGEAAQMDDSTVRDLIFRPGFSTAQNVSSVSGRGVGLDVVRNTIEKLRGDLTVESSAGKGTDFRLRLPATVLISRGILLEAGMEEFILPIDSVRDLVRMPAHELRSYRETRLAVIDGEALPILFLRELLGGPPDEQDPEFLSIAVLEQASGAFGIAVDAFKGEVQTVIQPLNARFAGFELCVGAAILGAGRVVLVLDANELSKRVVLRAELPALSEIYGARNAENTSLNQS
jgi:chemotaxis protein histidine kinase CheA